jgi:DNA-binding Lrp family transcriptional regulator
MSVLSRAYILIEAEAGLTNAILVALRNLHGVQTADPVTGPYDIIVIVELNEQRDVGRLVMNDIHAIAGIKRTITCLAI